MKTKKLGHSNLEISELGLGCMGMSEFYGETNEAESLKTIDRALELGINFFDTADMYGMGDNEALLAKALKGRRDKFIVATKFGIVRNPQDPTQRGISGKPEYVKKACEASLKRLNIETIDLYYQHRVDPTVPIEETVGAMAELVKEGKVRYLGLSEAGMETIKKAHKTHPISALQSEYSLWFRDPEKGHLELTKELGITFVAYSPIGRGFLTGAIKERNFDVKDFRTYLPKLQGDNFDKNYELVLKLEELAKEKNCTTAQLAIAWTMFNYDHIVPIPGTKRIKYLEQNVGALDIKLTSQEVSNLNELFKDASNFGDRYTPDGMRMVNI